jgi:putative transposase
MEANFPMARYRHYKNRGGPGDLIFATTTALDFAHVLRRPEMKDQMVEHIIDAHRRYQAQLFAYVVMNNHFHLVSRMPDSHGSSWFMQRLKEQATKELLANLNDDERKLMSAQVGLDFRECWHRSFDSIKIYHSQVRGQKINYIHQNPVRAGLVSDIAVYKWSSAQHFAASHWNPETGLDLENLN